jgi:hypothetical protein
MDQLNDLNLIKLMNTIQNSLLLFGNMGNRQSS